MCISPCVCVCVLVCWHVAKLKIPIPAEHRSNGISGTQRAQMAQKSSGALWKGHKNGRVPPPPVLIHPFSACYPLPRLGPARAFSPTSVLWELYSPPLFKKNFMSTIHSERRMSFEMSNGLTGSSVMKFWEKNTSAALRGTTDGIRALLLPRQDRKQEGKAAHAESYSKNWSLIN